jgi:hypothetical protein
MTIVSEPPFMLDAPDPEPRRETLCTAELAECACPDYCERDHDLD